jgi:hypothetical protein
VAELKSLCDYQEKTIAFLRQEKWQAPQFNEIRLLRYEINRISTENEELRERLDNANKLFDTRNSSCQGKL